MLRRRPAGREDRRERRRKRRRSRRRDSNPRPTAYKAVALPAELLRRPCIVGAPRHGRSVRNGHGPADCAATLDGHAPEARRRPVGDGRAQRARPGRLPRPAALRREHPVRSRSRGGRRGRPRTGEDGSAARRRDPLQRVQLARPPSEPKGAVRRAYLGQVEYFGVFCPETAGVYLVPIEAAQLRRQGALRVVAPRNGQRAGIRFAAEYLIGTWRVGVAEAQVRATPARAGPGPRAPRRREG